MICNGDGLIASYFMDGERLAAWQPPTDADVALARRKLHRVHNPVGWMLSRCFLATNWGSSFACEYRIALEETRKLLIGWLNA